jgi:hypothetical protein
MSIETDRYRDAALHQFSRLQPIFARNGNFWRLGNAFDTTIDYFGFIDGGEAKAFAGSALDRYEKTKGDWFDDFGWWGIAALKASQRPNLFPGFVGRFRDVANGAWRTMADNAPKVWVKADQAKYADYAPRFEGGVWNAYWTDDCNPIDPCNALQGIQNTVTNGLFLILAARLGCSGRADCQQAANRQYGFLRPWFEAKSPPDALLAPCPGGGEGAFVRERVSAYGSGAPAHAYRPSLAWSGDQGLIVSGLIDRTILEPKAYAETVPLARTILRGAREYLTDSGGIVQPWRERDGLGAPGGDADDYMTGPGVFMRTLLYAYRANPDLKTFLKQAGYLDIVRANAEKALEPPDVGADDDRALILLTNNLATLTAAVVMLDR